LAALRDGLRAHEAELAAAVSADFGLRAREETLLLELLPLYDQISHARKHLRQWMKPERVRTTWFLQPSKSYIVRQPLGVIGVIGAWNYPLLLAVGPVIDALAAGNHVMLKPSELAPRTAELLARIVSRRFDAAYVTTVLGGQDVAAEFASLPFDHLLFTGSARVGRMVMRAASENLTPVTLELGGKCPAIVHADYPLETATRRLMVGKLYNAGQTCVAPDYLLLPYGSEQAFEQAAARVVSELYPTLLNDTGYTRILSRGHYSRVKQAVDEARAAGARVVTFNPANETGLADHLVFPPTIVFGAPPGGGLLADEIFGPVLPVVSYKSLDEAIAFVNARPRPLALYYFDNAQDRIDRVVNSTISGGVAINDVVIHVGQHNLPFGGVGPSGMGQYHGVHGFRTFSKEKGVMVQGRWAATRLLQPPYGAKARAIINRLLRMSLR
jgi:coniferyl-aldehyde dehydrogenase